MSFETGTLVISTSGRDCETVLAVIGKTQTHLILANGRKRRIEKPKLKKIKHIKPLELSLTKEECDKLRRNELTNKMLYKGIKKSIDDK